MVTAAGNLLDLMLIYMWVHILMIKNVVLADMFGLIVVYMKVISQTMSSNFYIYVDMEKGK